MGWVQGTGPGADRLHYDGGGASGDGPALEEFAEMPAGPVISITCARITLRLAWPGILAAGIYIFMIGFAASTCRRSSAGRTASSPSRPTSCCSSIPAKGCRNMGRAAALSTLMIALGASLSWWYGRHEAPRAIAIRSSPARPIGRAYPRSARHVITAWLPSRRSTSSLSQAPADPGADLGIAAALFPAAFGRRPSARFRSCISAACPGTSRSRGAPTRASLTRADADAHPRCFALRSPGWCCARGFRVAASPPTPSRSCRMRCRTSCSASARCCWRSMWSARSCRFSARSGSCCCVFVVARLSYAHPHDQCRRSFRFTRELEEAAAMSGRLRPACTLARILAAADRPDPDLCLAVDRPADGPRADAGGAADHARQHHASGRGLEPVAQRSDRTRRSADAGHAPLIVPLIALYWLAAGRRDAALGS